MKCVTSCYSENISRQGERRTENHWHIIDLKHICYATRTSLLEWQTGYFIRTAFCEAVRWNKFWNKKIHRWFRSYFWKSKEKVVPWIQTCNHYYQNESCWGKTRTDNQWHSRPLKHPLRSDVGTAWVINSVFYLNRVMRGSSIVTSNIKSN